MRTEYEARLNARNAAAAKHESLSRVLGNWRLIVAITGAALAWWNFYLLPIPVAIFVALLVAHDRIERNLIAERRAITLYQRSLDRLENKWPGFGESGDRFQDEKHPYSGDLDIFGRGSLFQLLNSARTSAGEATLAGWLAAPSTAEQVKLRHAAIDDLRPRLDLREDLALLGDDVRAEVHAEWLARWAAQPAVSISSALRISGSALAIFNGVTGLLTLFQVLPLFPFVLGVLGVMLYSLVSRRRVEEILAAMEAPAKDLHIVAGILARLERETFTAPRLVALQQELKSAGLPPSRRIARLTRLADMHDWEHNLFFRIFAFVLVWSPQIAFAIERWRLEYGPEIGRWISAVAEMEALSSLAAYASEHPADPYPQLLDEGSVFDGAAIAHPLLPEISVVRNDVRLDPDMRLLLISGSNMSGKSTLLRSVGLNAVLAWAGAPVRAESLAISSIQVGASMRTQDSVLDGRSRFYAEITRLRQVVDLASSRKTLLFLLDELLSGTNSHDRRIGAEAIVRSLVERGAIGLVTTHDLALAHIADDLAPRAANVHFEDHIEDGKIAFDYRMHPGVVQKSNAIALMRSVGLIV